MDKFQAGDKVRIKESSGVARRWWGLECLVAQTKEKRKDCVYLKPLGTRPDGYESSFWWKTANAELVESAVDVSDEAILKLFNVPSHEHVYVCRECGMEQS